MAANISGIESPYMVLFSLALTFKTDRRKRFSAVMVFGQSLDLGKKAA
jgi:hypothetical protein